MIRIGLALLCVLVVSAATVHDDAFVSFMNTFNKRYRCDWLLCHTQSLLAQLDSGDVQTLRNIPGGSRSR